MLSEHERKALKDIERDICAGDPDIARYFDHAFERPARLWPYTTAIVIGVLLLVAGILLELAAFMLIGFLVTASAIGARWFACAHHRHHEEHP